MAHDLEDDFAELRCSALRRIPPADRRRLFPFFEVRKLPPRASLFRFGERARAFFVVMTGEVLFARRADRRPLRRMRVLERGDVCGESALVDGEGDEQVAQTEGPVTALALTRERYSDAVREVPALKEAIETWAALQPFEGDFVAALQRTPLFADANIYRLVDLFEETEMHAVTDGETILKEGDPPRAICMVIDGELQATRGGEVVDLLYPGDVFGDLAFFTRGKEPLTVSSKGDANVLYLGADDINDAVPPSLAGDAPHLSGKTHVLMVVASLPDSQLPAPLPVLTDLLAQTLRRDHRDPVLVIDLVPVGEPTAADPALDDEGVARLRFAVADDHFLGDAVKHAIDTFRAWLPKQSLRDPPGPSDDVYVLVNAGPAQKWAAAMSPVVTRLVVIGRDTFEQFADDSLSHLHAIHAALLDGPIGRNEEPAYRSRAVRLRLDGARLASARRLDELDERTRATLSRFARAVSDRRVGVALGGGGAWGYAHVALLHALLDQGIPIDMVSGASFGSVVGAYFVADGRDGLEQVVRDGKRVEWSTQLAMISSWSLAVQVDLALGRRRLEDMEVPLLPVATDVASGTQYLPTLGTLGYGVRASGSFPGIFTPTTTSTGRFVDGGMINNVPDSVLHAHGAFLAIASNIVASPEQEAVRNPPFGVLGRFFHELSPTGRIKDLVRSLFILFHTTGNRQALFADVEYQSEQVPFMPWEFGKGAEILERAKEGAACAAEEARRKWDALRPKPVRR